MKAFTKKNRAKVMAKLSLAMGLAGLVSSAKTFGATYTFAPLAIPNVSPQSNAFGINNNGEVVGQFLDSPQTAGYSTGGGLLSPLGTAISNSSSAQAVNSGGIAVGAGIYNSDMTGTQYAVYFNTLVSPTQMFDMGSGTLGGSVSIANAVYGNSTSFEAVGQSMFSGGTASRAFRWNSGNTSLTPLDTATTTGLGGTGVSAFSAAQGLNGTGYIVGQATNANGDTHAFLYSPVTSRMYDLGTALNASSGDFSNAVAINASDIIVGQTDTSSGYQQAFSYTPNSLPTLANPNYSGGTYTPLGSLDGSNPESQAFAINLTGIIVGTSSFGGSDDSHAFIYQSGTMSDLNLLTSLPAGWVLNTATGISDSGEITGTATYTDESGSNVYAYELNLSSVPEPGTMGLLAVGCVVGILRRRR